MAFEAFFLDAPGGRRFCVHTPAVGPARSAVLYLHPFAEEMNRARRMAALQARALAAAGHAVLQIDLGGCGDSEGDFSGATWEGWVEDALAGARWLADRHQAPMWLWGTRAGALVAAAALRQGAPARAALFIQPAVSGALALRQFLRLAAAADTSVKGRGADELAKALEGGLSVRVAGYELGPGLSRGLAAATLDMPATRTRIECFEMGIVGAIEISPPLAGAIARWRSAGHDARAAIVEGPPFWQTTEISLSAALVTATVAALGTP